MKIKKSDFQSYLLIYQIMFLATNNSFEIIIRPFKQSQ